MALGWYNILAVVVLVSAGSINTIILKTVDEIRSEGVYGQVHTFFHPLVETFLFFVGASLCLLYYGLAYWFLKLQGKHKTHPLTRGDLKVKLSTMLLPNVLDIFATACTLMGLTLTYASSFQIFRGTILIFVPICARFIIGRKLTTYQTISLLIMISGLIFCGISDYFSELTTLLRAYSNSVIIGDGLIITGQVFSALQIVIEEKHLRHNNSPPLYYVGRQGCLGMLITSVLLLPMQFIPCYLIERPRPVLEDTEDAALQFWNDGQLKFFLPVYVFSSSLYYFTLLYSAKQISSTNTVVFVALKALVVWMYGISLHNEDYYPVQVMGFSLFVAGVLAFNNLVEVTTTQ